MLNKLRRYCFNMHKSRFSINDALKVDHEINGLENEILSLKTTYGAIWLN